MFRWYRRNLSVIVRIDSQNDPIRESGRPPIMNLCEARASRHTGARVGFKPALGASNSTTSNAFAEPDEAIRCRKPTGLCSVALDHGRGEMS